MGIHPDLDPGTRGPFEPIVTRWFRVLEPRMPARKRPDRKAEIRTMLSRGELLEVSEVKRGWVRLSQEELMRRGIPSTDTSWALIDASALGSGQLLEEVLLVPQEPPLAHQADVAQDQVVATADALQEEVPSSACVQFAINCVVEGNERAWQRFQARSSLLNQSTFSFHQGFLSMGGDIVVETMTIQDAKARCVRLKGCVGFTWQGGPDLLEPVSIRFKDKWSFHMSKTHCSCRVERSAIDENPVYRTTVGQHVRLTAW